MASLTPVPVRRVAVYELMNRKRMESVIVITRETEKGLLSRLNRRPPPSLDRWSPLDDGLSLQTLDPSIKEELAEEFVKSYLSNMRRRTWRFHVWRPED